jgi:DNA adenine methylase Dam
MELKGLISYSGNKFKIYKKYLHKYFEDFNKIHEPFLGSGVCLYNSKNGGFGIDCDENLISIHKSLSDTELLSKINETYYHYFKNGREKDSYFKLREDFNLSYRKNKTNEDNVHMLHILIQLSFNSLLRFSKNGYNVPFGKKNIDFDRIRIHQNEFYKKNIQFECGEYYDLKLDEIDMINDVIYFDPPYLASKYQYEGWNKNDEVKLLSYISELDKKGFKFVLSNTFIHKKVINNDLIEWSKSFNVLDIKKRYNSWSSAVKTVEKETDTQEIIISNF